MHPTHLTGVFFALLAAVLYGAGDFSGGVASRRHHVAQVLLLASCASMVLLSVLVVLLGEAVPPPADLFWAGLAGIAGALGLAALYRALAMGNVALVAPTAGVIGAGLPVVWGAFTEGLPSPAQLLGFIAAVFGIWFVTRNGPASATGKPRQSGLILAILAGIAFGAFFILIAQMDSSAVLLPLLVAKGAAACIALLLVAFGGMPLPSVRRNPYALLAGALDGVANAIYLLAQHHTRLDVAVVLTSLYPAVTVLLACLLLKAKISGSQWAGVLLCLVAIALIVA